LFRFFQVPLQALLHLRIIVGALDLPLHLFLRLRLHRVRVAQTDDQQVACFVLSHKDLP
jgi:hypothetical protein